MAKAKAKSSKSKFDAKSFLLRRGEVLAMGTAGVALVVLLFLGVSKWASADDPNKIARELAMKSDQVTQNIATGKASEADLKAVEPPAFIVTPPIYRKAQTSDFPVTGPLFDPTAKPSTKRENPLVYNVTAYQVDLTRSAMPAYDIIYDGDEPQIAVLITKTGSTLDASKIKDAIALLKTQGDRGKVVKRPPPPKNPGAADTGTALGGGAYNANSKRADEGKVIKYIPLKEFDEAAAKQNPPAFTVVPVRLITIHAVVPYKRQLEEIKRALRLPVPAPIVDARTGLVTNQAAIDAAEAQVRQWGPWYDGFEIQRKVTRRLPNGQEVIEQDWARPKDAKVSSTEGNYEFEEQYVDKIDTRKFGDQLDEGFYPYFLKSEMMLSMPLPLLSRDLNVKYPDIRLKPILDNIKKLEAANKPVVTASDLAERLSKAKPPRASIYGGRLTTDAFGGTAFGGQQRPTAPATPVAPKAVPGKGPRLPEGAGHSLVAQDAVDNFLLRFVDSDVKPDRTYEYQIRLRMWNPNYGMEQEVANPEYAKDEYKTLYSPWLPLDQPISVPAESFLYAYDTKAYRDQTAAAYATQKDLLARLQLKDNQAVVQAATWMEQVRTDSGNKREPVGAWVVTEIPVGRGEYVGRKQYVKLPLWSSEAERYVLREVPDKVVGGGPKAKDQPKGWLVDFSTPSVLVDFEGGRLKNQFDVTFDPAGNLVRGTRSVDEDAATEMLVVEPDGKLAVYSSKADEGDPTRKEVTAKWTDWLRAVESRKAAAEPDPKKK